MLKKLLLASIAKVAGEVGGELLGELGGDLLDGMGNMGGALSGRKRSNCLQSARRHCWNGVLIFESSLAARDERTLICLVLFRTRHVFPRHLLGEAQPSLAV